MYFVNIYGKWHLYSNRHLLLASFRELISKQTTVCACPPNTAIDSVIICKVLSDWKPFAICHHPALLCNNQKFAQKAQTCCCSYICQRKYGVQLKIGTTALWPITEKGCHNPHTVPTLKIYPAHCTANCIIFQFSPNKTEPPVTDGAVVMCVHLFQQFISCPGTHYFSHHRCRYGSSDTLMAEKC